MTQLLLAIIYLAFISLGLPDSLLGSAWPTMYQQFGRADFLCGNYFHDYIRRNNCIQPAKRQTYEEAWNRKSNCNQRSCNGGGFVWILFSHSFWALCLWAIPYGLGAGSVDASLNNYVALHYESRHMSWLHCMWGLGATAGPYIMGIALSMGQGWNMGYRYIGIIQVVLTAVLVFSLPLWKGRKSTTENLQNAEMEQLLENVSEKADTTAEKALSLREILKIAGAKEVMLCFFCYCALEQTAGLWASSYLTLHKGVSSETAAIFASLFYIGITVGRAISGFITMKLNDTQMVRLGQSIIILGIMAMVLPGSNVLALAGLILIGLGCAPIYPCVIHSTPAHFGADKSQAIIGVQMAFAYIGILAMPPLFGVLASRISVALLPCYLFAILVVMVIMHELLTKKTT